MSLRNGPPDLPVAVVGAGAAGLMAAIFAAAGGRRVLLLEGTADGGRKILISGGGRCNILPSELQPERFVTASSRNTLRKMLRSWPLDAQRVFFEREARIPLVLEPETGKLFPASQQSRHVRDRLVTMALGRGVQVRFGTRVTSLDPSPPLGRWRVGLEDGQAIEAGAVVVATGGLSVPATGSDGAGLRLLATLGHTIHATYPALTPLTAAPVRHAPLSGVSVQVVLKAPGAPGARSGRGGFLFTHRGYSGPAVLDLSDVAVRSRLAGGPLQPILVQWTDADSAAWDFVFRGAPGEVTVGSLVRQRLPARVAQTLLEEAGVDPGRPAAHLRRIERRAVVEVLTRYPLPWAGDEGYKKAEVTGGGVALGEVHSATMESRLHPGLFVCGEVLDAFGPIGGYNFAWAWATGRAAGTAVSGQA